MGNNANIITQSSMGNLFNSRESNGRVSSQSPKNAQDRAAALAYNQLSGLNIVPETENHNYEYEIKNQTQVLPSRKDLNRDSRLFESNSPASAGRHHQEEPLGAQPFYQRAADQMRSVGASVNQVQAAFRLARRSLPKHAPMSEAAKNSEKELMLYRNRVLVDR
jgi:hypothetical protein